MTIFQASGVRSSANRWIGRLVGVALLCLLSGCATADLLETSWEWPPPDSAPQATPQAKLGLPQATDTKDALPSTTTGKDAEAAPKAAPPHTLPQALCAYWRCLWTCPCDKDGSPPKDGDEKGKKHSDEKSDKNGKADKNGDKKTPDKTDDKGQQDKKNPSPPAKATAAGGNGQEAKKNPDKQDEGDQKDDDNGSLKNGDKSDAPVKDDDKKPDWLSAHGQTTLIPQVHSNFPAKYTGPFSLLPNEPSATSETATLFLAARMWEGGEVVFNPEIAGGRGFSGTNGMAGFPNGEITRVGLVEPTLYLARLYLRQTWGFGGEQEKVEDAANDIAGTRDVNHFTLQVGKMAATDVADDNKYAHDPRTQFLNWALMYNGAWDYPANVRGYTFGISMEYATKYWTLNYGVFAEPAVANGAPLDPHFLKANGHVLELEQRYKWNDQPGTVRWMAYLNNAHMGSYSEALEQMPVNPNVTLTRSYRIKYGFGLSWDQDLNKYLGVFARLGWNDGHTETWAYTPIDETASLGFAVKGNCWCRPTDTVGVAGVINGLSPEHRRYLAAGGLDFNIGDGALNYRPEEIVELYYNYTVSKGINLTADFQHANNPAYNRDRGPVTIGGLRIHLEF